MNDRSFLIESSIDGGDGNLKISLDLAKATPIFLKSIIIENHPELIDSSYNIILNATIQMIVNIISIHHQEDEWQQMAQLVFASLSQNLKKLKDQHID